MSEDMGERNSQGSQDAADQYRSDFCDDPDMRELVELFVSELPDRVEAVRSAASAGDPETLTRLAHQLKGAGSGYGFAPISDAAGRLERELGGLDAANVADAVNHVAREVDELVEICQRIIAHG